MGQRAADQTNRPTVRMFTVEAVEMPVGDVQPVSTAWTVAVVAGVFAAVLVFWGRVLYSDTYTALSAGRLIARSGLPSHDSLTVAAHGGRWIDEQWLAHLIYYGAWRVGGYALMGAVSALLVAAAFGLLFRLMVRRGASPVFAFGCVGLAFAVSDLNLETRPQSFSYPLFVLLLTLLCAEQRSPRFRRRLLLRGRCSSSGETFTGRCCLVSLPAGRSRSSEAWLPLAVGTRWRWRGTSAGSRSAS